MTDTRPPAPLAPEQPALTAADLVRATGGTLIKGSERPISGAAVDSRAVRPGNLFVALPGERTDGHRFLGSAVAAGAAALLVARPPQDPEELGDVTVVVVPDTLAGFQAIAGSWRARFDPLVVGVTGSVAKTSTKDVIAAILGSRYRTLKSEGNQNNEIGLPLTLMRLGVDDEAAVLEMGMYVGGEIATLARLARPRIGVVTAVREVHLSRIGTIDAVEKAKGELVEVLPADGVAILNADDERVRRMGDRTSARTLTYGFDPTADVSATDVESRGLDGMAFTLVTPRGRRSVTIPTLGRHAVHNALAGTAAGLAAGLTVDEIAAGLLRIETAPHRGQVIQIGPLTILDDAYNASPSSMIAALELLETLPGRRIAVLGEMLELGDAQERGHREVGAVAGRVAELLVVVGAGAGGIAEGALGAGLDPDRLIAVPDRESALVALRAKLRDGDVVLVKASRGAALEELIPPLAATYAGAGAPTEMAGTAHQPGRSEPGRQDIGRREPRQREAGR